MGCRFNLTVFLIAAKRAGVLLVLVALVSCVTSRQRVQGDYVTVYYEGLAAYERSDYVAAMATFKQLALEGDALSQLYLGSMYERGEGVATNIREAIRWYQSSAAQGNVDAQMNLAEIYSTGELVAQDLVQAYLWWTLAAEQGESGAEQSRRQLLEKMMPEQISAAQQTIDQWHRSEDGAN